MESSRSSSPAKLTDTFLTQFQRLKISKDNDITGANLDTINALYSDLNSCVMSLDQKVGGVLKKHELEFLNEYKERMYRIQKEMRILKEKANEAESQRRKVEKIQSLEKERDMLREKAEKLDRLCKEQKESVDTWKNKAEEMEDDRRFLEEQIIAARKQNQHLQEQLKLVEEHNHVNSLAPDPSLEENNTGQTTESVENQIWVSSEQSEFGKSAISSLALKKSQLQLNQTSLSPSKQADYFQQVQTRFKQIVSHLQNQLEVERKTLKNLRGAKTNFILEKGELEDIFLQCVEDGKKEILARKLKASRYQPKNKKKSTLDRERDITLDEFKDIDKRKVMELFLSSEKVRKFLYDKMFSQEGEFPSQATPATKSIQSSLSGPLPKKPSTTHGLHGHVFSMPYFDDDKLHRPSTAPLRFQSHHAQLKK
ncbi:unnamed protein product [Blepharisma stoltei]|uniref:Uncharacterized protein n=1 Tax=Blepharisma stoltei TaxID=1481888 RepID=A0AAU9JC58_9CILI|nr:unnamed protein product [Blepharisma stoltei]